MLDFRHHTHVSETTGNDGGQKSETAQLVLETNGGRGEPNNPTDENATCLIDQACGSHSHRLVQQTVRADNLMNNI